MVDWSAAAAPVTGKDSIWIAYARQGQATKLENPPTRKDAMARVGAILEQATRDGVRLLAGFDFPFGYPEGTARALTGQDDWQALWAALARQIEEGPDNANNRFAVAADLNGVFAVDGPFWGHGGKDDGRFAGLPFRRPDAAPDHPPRKRFAEDRTRGAKEVWQLNGAGSVGGQALTGIAALERLRRKMPVTIWPFEPLIDDRHVIAEIYPSLLPPHPQEPVKDAGQVRAVAEALAMHDACGRLAGFLDAPAQMPEKVRREEACILGMDAPEAFANPRPTPALRRRLRYVRDPAEIYRASFATVAREARLERFPPDIVPMVTRLIHSCGMTEIADRLAFSADVMSEGRAALQRGAPILCDCEMVRSGVIRRYLPAENPLICTLNDPSVPDLAAGLATTRSAAAVELWRDRLAGAVVVVGNAPTALFHLLERLDDGWPRPAAILGFPVGFIGAAESKAELARDPRNVPFVALRGRKGGSAMASAALNALAAGIPEGGKSDGG